MLHDNNHIYRPLLNDLISFKGTICVNYTKIIKTQDLLKVLSAQILNFLNLYSTRIIENCDARFMLREKHFFSTHN